MLQLIVSDYAGLLLQLKLFSVVTVLWLQPLFFSTASVWHRQPLNLLL